MPIPRFREGRLLRPLPISTRISIRLESMSLTRSMTTSPPRRPAPPAFAGAGSSDAERGLVLETGTGRGLDQPGDLLPSEHPWQLPRIVRAGQLMGEVGAAERDGEEKAQRRGLRIHLRWLRTLLDLCELEAADVVAGRGIGGAAEKSGKGLDMPDIVVLCLLAKAADRHVRDHAAAKIADRLVAHRRLLSCGWSVGTPNPQDGTPAPSSSIDQSVGAILAVCSSPARAGSFCVKGFRTPARLGRDEALGGRRPKSL